MCFNDGSTFDFLLLVGTKLSKMILAHLFFLSLGVGPFLVNHKTISVCHRLVVSDSL